MDLTQFMQDNATLILIGVILAIMVRGPMLARIKNVQKIDPHEMFRSFFGQKGKSLLLDIRSEWEFQRGPRLKGSLNVPAGEINRRIDEIRQHYKRGPVLIICASGSARAQRAALALRKAGFDDVRILQGGLAMWRGAGYPTEH